VRRSLPEEPDQLPRCTGRWYPLALPPPRHGPATDRLRCRAGQGRTADV